MKLAIYDFDGTYLKSESLRTVYSFWKEQGLVNKQYKKTWRTIQRRYIYNRLHLFGWSKPRFRANAMALTADLFRSVEKDVLDDFIIKLYNHFQSSINSQMKKQLKEDIKAGFYTVLLSGNFNILIEPFINEGFNEVIGTNVLKNNEIIEAKDVEIIISDIKAQVIRSKFPNADYENSKAYTDSYYDLPILELVGNPICVNPDVELTEIAKARKYEIFTGEEV